MTSDAEQILREAQKICEQYGQGIYVIDVLNLEKGYGIILSIPKELWNRAELDTLVSRLEAIKGVRRVMMDLPLQH